MESPSHGSVTLWLDELKLGHEAAAQQLWNRYFFQLVTLARHRFRGLGLGRDADEEDIALSALKSAMLGVQNNRFPDLSDRTGLWPLLVTITTRKSINELNRHRAKKRNRGLEQRLADNDMLAGTGPTPEFALMLAEYIDSLVAGLGDETLRTIVALKLEAYTNEEIASKLDVSARTVVRKLHRIRQEWEAAAAE
jgi:DNA-directed RNA polymerase specialized sigma24 family protein